MMRPRRDPRPPHREMLRAVVLCGAVVLGALAGASAAGHAIAAVQSALWTGPFQNAVCLGPACLVTQGMVEISFGEYQQPSVPPGASTMSNSAYASYMSSQGGGTSGAP